LRHSVDVSLTIAVLSRQHNAIDVVGEDAGTPHVSVGVDSMPLISNTRSLLHYCFFSMLVNNAVETIGWQWHQLDHMQIICTSLQTDNHTSTSSLNFLQADALPDAQPSVSKH